MTSKYNEQHHNLAEYCDTYELRSISLKILSIIHDIDKIKLMLTLRRGISKIKLFIGCCSYSLCILRKPFASTKLFVCKLCPAIWRGGYEPQFQASVGGFLNYFTHIFCTYLYTVVGVSTERFLVDFRCIASTIWETSFWSKEPGTIRSFPYWQLTES